MAGVFRVPDQMWERIRPLIPAPAKVHRSTPLGWRSRSARLRAEVQRRLAEVQESRARIVTAGYEEGRRLERDLHDGAQQRLVSIGLAIRHVQGRLVLTERTVEGHVRSVLMKLSLPEGGGGHRRVLAVLAYLRAADAQR